jgi:DNA-binding CsgD family transcriptional regulator
MARGRSSADNGSVASELTLQRVRSDVEVVARAGLDMATFVAELEASLQRAVPHVATCIALTDPATRLLTGTFKFGDLVEDDARDHEWALMEYGGEEPTSFVHLADRRESAVSMCQETGGDVARSPRLRDFLTPTYGYTDELRLVARQGDRTWGGLAMFRGDGDAPFSEADVAFVGSLSEHMAAGLRSGLLARLGGSARSGGAVEGPVVVIVGPNDEPLQVSMGAETLLAELASGPNMADASGIIGGLVACARRYAAGQVDVLPRARARIPSGRWLVLHASPLSNGAGATGDVVVTIEEARPPEIVPLVVAAFELTARERDVTQLVLQGVDTKEIAAALHMSRYTVQDHLKSVFDKADVRSRRELISRVYFDQYVPRMGGELAPSGWFTED